MGRYFNTTAAPFQWTWRQATGFLGGLGDYVRAFHVDDVLPPSLRSGISWLMRLYPRAAGVRDTTPREQINANIIFIVFWALGGLLSLGLTTPFIVIHVALLAVGVWRYIPAVGELWIGLTDRLPIKDDYDIPFWRSD